MFLSGGAPAVGQEMLPLQYNLQPQQYKVKPSDVTTPKDVPPGAYIRMIQPFENWTLICDENLIRRQKICNITQTLVDQKGAAAFSWSLAAAENGQPMMILRAPFQVGAGQPIVLRFPGLPAPLIVKTSGCDTAVCVAMVQVGSVLRGQIEKGSIVEFSYAAGARRTVRLNAPLKGLSTALAAIN